MKKSGLRAAFLLRFKIITQRKRTFYVKTITDTTMTSINKDFCQPPAENNIAVELFTARLYRIDNQFKP